MVYKIIWDYGMGNAYLYGSEIYNYNGGISITLENSLMPAGTTINRWKSHTNFQVDKVTPCLPLLYPLQTYRIDWSIESTPKSGIYIRIIFFDMSYQIIATEILKSSNQCIRVPENMYQYHIELINAGAQWLKYEYILIEAVNGSSDSDIERKII